jgi:hypothetical protein
MKRIACIGFVFVFVLPAALAVAQTTTPQQDKSSLGDYARQVHKDPGAKAKPKVFDNDNLPKDDKLSIVGQPAEVPAEGAAEGGEKTAADSKEAAPADGKKAEGTKPVSADEEQAKRQALYKEWQDKLAAQKSQIDLASRELDVLQREYQLRAAAMYADVGNRMRNSAQWDKEEADYKQKIADKQKAVDEAKQKLTDLEEGARKAGVPAAMRE